MTGRIFCSLLLFPLLLSCGGSGVKNTPIGFEVSSTVPVSDGYLATDGVVRVNFGKAAKASTINESTFTVSGVTGTVEVDATGRAASFTPSAPLVDGTVYTATISATVSDTDGKRLDGAYVWTFTAKIMPDAPTALTATGSKNKISLSWTGSPSTIDGYKVYRSTDGSTYSRVNDELVPSGTTTYEDTISSPGGDGVVYTYKIRASNGVDSAATNVVRQIHGTRLAASYSSVEPLESLTSGVYVIEGTTRVDGADFTVPSGYKVYLFDGSTLKVEEGYSLVVEGLFAVAADEDHPVTISGHDGTGGVPTAPAGFLLEIADTATDYSSTTGQGTLFQYATINRLQCTGEAIQVGSAGPRFFNNKIDFNCAVDPGTGYVKIKTGSSATFSQNDITDGTFLVAGSLGSAFKAELNDVQNGAWELKFAAYAGPGVASGQFVNNRFDAGVHKVDVNNVTGTGTIPLGENYWVVGTPTVNKVESADISVDFDPVLSSAPADAGATW